MRMLDKRSTQRDLHSKPHMRDDVTTTWRESLKPSSFRILEGDESAFTHSQTKGRDMQTSSSTFSRCFLLIRPNFTASRLMPNSMHFFSRQYWQRLRFTLEFRPLDPHEKKKPLINAKNWKSPINCAVFLSRTLVVRDRWLAPSKESLNSEH